jgi:hypothetical protein
MMIVGYRFHLLERLNEGDHLSPGVLENRPHLKNTTNARHWRFTSVILAAQETEIRRIAVRKQPRQIV